MILERNGYGSNFNIIEIIDKTIKKTAKNDYGKMRMKEEINFYKYLIENNISFKYPKILDYSIEKNFYKMEYLNEYTELYKIYPTLKKEEQKNVLHNIYSTLKIIHENKIMVSKEQCIKDIQLETLEKINLRIGKIQHIIDKYSHIKIIECYVKNFYHTSTIVRSIESIKEKINIYINKFTSLLEEKVSYSCIHGDCQFNNILIDNNNNNNIVFIDPRGYFGNTKLFGLNEYDFSKVFFALSGYDEFDNRSIDSLKINEITINIDLQMLDPDILRVNKFVTSLVISTWLGNAQMFIDDEKKCIYSYFIAMFLASVYLFD